MILKQTDHSRWGFLPHPRMYPIITSTTLGWLPWNMNLFHSYDFGWFLICYSTEKVVISGTNLISVAICGGWWYLMSKIDWTYGLWPPDSLHTLGADGHILQRDRLFMWTKILCIEYILWGIPTIESAFDVANMVKTATMKDVPINNDALLNIQACWIHVWENGICSPVW